MKLSVYLLHGGELLEHLPSAALQLAPKETQVPDLVGQAGGGNGGSRAAGNNKYGTGNRKGRLLLATIFSHSSVALLLPSRPYIVTRTDLICAASRTHLHQLGGEATGLVSARAPPSALCGRPAGKWHWSCSYLGTVVGGRGG